MMAMDEPQSLRIDEDPDELAEAERIVRQVFDASLESYDKDEARRAKFEEQEQTDLDCAAGASLYEGSRYRLEQPAASAHPATRLAVTRTRMDRANGDEDSVRREKARQEEKRNQARRDRAEAKHKALTRLRSAIIPLIEAKLDRKGKGRGRSCETIVSTCALEAMRPSGLIKCAREAGVHDQVLQQALLSVQPWKPTGMLTEDDFIVVDMLMEGDCSVCHMFKTTTPHGFGRSRSNARRTAASRRCSSVRLSARIAMRSWFAITVCTSMAVGGDSSLPTADPGKKRRLMQRRFMRADPGEKRRFMRRRFMRIVVKYRRVQGETDAQSGGVTG